MSGPALLAIGVLATARVVERTGGMPVIGVGGVRSADDVRQYLKVGASLVAIGTAALADPHLPERIVAETWSGPMAEVILALDLPSGADAMRLLDRLPEARWVKVGSILMTREGPPFIRALTGRGLQVFLDLKWHDIPNTVAGAVAAAGDLGVSMATVHALGGRAMMAAAAASATGGLSLVAVTVLTSHDAESYGRATGRSDVALTEEAARQALEATGSGLAGVVCSSAEVASVRRVVPEQSLLVVPGIRRETDVSGDQVRTATAREAARAGATHLVVGRPVLHAPDPARALGQLLEEARCVTS